jgi:hypothetical protein
MILGLHAWLGMAVLLALLGLAVDLLSGRGFRRRPLGGTPPSGSFVFVPIAAVAGMLGGAFCAFLPAAENGVVVFAVYAAGGATYGVALWALARNGLLPFPDGG